MSLTSITMKALLEAGVHFGHRSNNWNPKMAKYIFLKRKGLHIINLQKTLKLVGEAYLHVRNVVVNGGNVLFVGTKKQAKESVMTQAKRCGHYYIINRWIGGLLTNFQVVKKSINYLKFLENIFSSEEEKKKYSKKELFALSKKKAKMEERFGGIKEMEKLPDLIFIVDAFYEKKYYYGSKETKDSNCCFS